jgi:hypothetical protein
MEDLGFVIDTQRLFSDKKYDISQEYINFFDFYLNKNELISMLPLESQDKIIGQKYNYYRSIIGPYINYKSLAISSIVNIIGLERLKETNLYSSHSTSELFLIPDKLNALEKRALKNLINTHPTINITYNYLTIIVRELYPLLNNDELRLFNTLYYSYEADLFFRKQENNLNLLDTHQHILKLTKKLSAKLKVEAEMQIFNELLENNTTYGSVFNPRKPLDQIITEIEETIEKLLYN